MFYFYENDSWMQRGIIGSDPFDTTDIPWTHQGPNPTVAMLIVSYLFSW